ncbi:MAG TPA: bifunctional precorrin-2 dehydrogenase/sirohydrochlorin ferrochelatase [Methylomirabilota bacterium]|nr:bifunctional precorrin-2 dehydrogenase/sirohydrochlorin ferrochelatase [Methylomirabilota bacterium]
MGLFPLFVDLEGRPCVVLGGGAVAVRKVEGLLAAGAVVTVVSPALDERLAALASEGRIAHVARGYADGDLAGAALAFAATDDGAVNGAVAREGRARGVWVNAADDPAHCDAILPAVVRRGAVTVAVSTGGASPALARAVRERIEAALPEAYGALAEAAADARRDLRASGRRASPDDWLAALDAGLRALLAGAPPAEASRRLRARLEDAACA